MLESSVTLSVLVRTILLRPFVWFFSLIWKTIRISNGSHVMLRMVGDEGGFDPPTLCIGLRSVASTCFVQIPVIVTNAGLAAVRNLAVRVELPRQLIPPETSQHVVVPTGESTYSIDISGDRSQRTFQMPSLRIDETVVFPIVLRISPNDWVSVPVGSESTTRGGLSLTEIGSRDPIKLIVLRMAITAHADNMRASRRRCEIWIAPAKTESDIMSQFGRLATVACIWKRKHRAFILPAIGPFVFMPSFPRRWFFDRVAVLHLVSRNAVVKLVSGNAVVKPEVGSWFEVDLDDGFVPAQAYRHLAANPREKRAVFREWIEEVYSLRPRYLR